MDNILSFEILNKILVWKDQNKERLDTLKDETPFMKQNTPVISQLRFPPYLLFTGCYAFWLRAYRVNL